MDLEIRLYDEFKRYSPGNSNVFNVSASNDHMVRDILKALGIPVETPAVILLNGRRAHLDTPLEAHSSLVIFSPVSGG